MNEYDDVYEKELAARYEDGVRDERERNRKINEKKDAAYRDLIVYVLKDRFPEFQWDFARILSEKSWPELRILMKAANSCKSAEEFRRVAEQS